MIPCEWTRTQVSTSSFETEDIIQEELFFDLGRVLAIFFFFLDECVTDFFFFFFFDVDIYLQLTPLTALIVYLHLHLQLRNKLTLHYSIKRNITYITIQSTVH